jgi:hypothetical protein
MDLPRVPPCSFSLDVHLRHRVLGAALAKMQELASCGIGWSISALIVAFRFVQERLPGWPTACGGVAESLERQRRTGIGGLLALISTPPHLAE